MKKRIVMFLAAAMAAVCAWGDTWKDPDTLYTWTYRINGGTAEIYGHSERTYEEDIWSPPTYRFFPAVSPSPICAVTIPSTLGGKPVTSIGSESFKDCGGLASVTIPDSVTSIGDSAFSGCSGLTNVTIGCGVASIMASAFHGCSGLMSILVSDDNANYSSVNGLLLSKDCKTLIQGVNGDVAITNSVTSIGSSAFSGCSGLNSVTIPNSVTRIGDCAFDGCSGLTKAL